MGATAKSPAATDHAKLPLWQRISGIAKRTDIRVWAALFVALAGIFLWADRADIGRTARSMRAADPWWLTGLILIALVLQWLFALLYIQLLRLTRHRVPVRAIAEALLQRHAVTTVVPVGIAPGSILFVRNLNDHGVPEDDSLLSLVIFSTLGHASLVIYAIPVMLWLALHHGLPALFVVGTAALSLLAGTVLALTLFLLRENARQARFERKLPSRLTTFVSAAKAHQISVHALFPSFLTALAIDGAGIAMLYAALRAVGERPAIGVAVAGYVVGTIFLVLSPAFQGLGLVEVSLVVALERLGLSHGHAASATLLFRVGELWLPLALGIAVQARTQPRLRGAPALLPTLMTAFTGVMSVVSVIAPMVPRHLNRVEDYSLLDPTDASRTLALLGGFMLLLLSYALWRRRRVAWLACLALSAVVALAHLLMAHDQGVAWVAIGNLALLLVYRRRFSVQSDVPTLRRGLAGFVASLLFAFAYGTAGFWFLDRRQFGVNFSVVDSLVQSTRLFFTLSSTDLHPRTRYADWYLDSISIIGVSAAVVAALSLIRPVVWRRRTLPQEKLETRSLIDRYGDSSLDYFKTTPDKYFFFSSSRDAVAAYGISSATAVVLGDPIAADDAAFTNILRELIEFTDANAWQLTFHQVPPQRLDAYRAAGLETLKIGEEAVVDVQCFSLSGNSMKSLRAAVNRLVRAGYSSEIHEPPHGPELINQLRTVSNEWLTLLGRRERGFTIGSWSDEYIGQSRVMTVQNQNGDVVAFVNLIPSGVTGEATFDLMRHLPDAPSGSMDVLLVRLIQHLKAAGFQRLSLGMTPWSAIGAVAVQHCSNEKR